MGKVSMLLFLCWLALLSAQPALAETIGTDSHNLRINSAAFSDEQPTPTPELPAELPPEKPFEVYYDNELGRSSEFGLTIENTLIDFGELTPSNPVSRVISFTLSNSTLSPSFLFGREDHPLLVVDGLSLPDTTCDNGSCSQSTAAPWSSELTYGFGYRCEGTDGVGCNVTFPDQTYYKQFADFSAKEDYTLITQASEQQRISANQLRLQINMAGSQAKGAYSSAVTLLFAPGL